MDQINSEDLTTDAVPSPPRGERLPPKPPKKTQQKPTTPEEANFTKPKKSRQKEKQIPNSAIANVINISHAQGIHIGNNVSINFGNRPSTTSSFDKSDEPTKPNFVKTASISRAMQSTEAVTRNLVHFVSQYIGENWPELCKLLGYTSGELHQFREKYEKDGIGEIIYQVLLEWTQNKPKEALVGVLCTAMWDANEKEAVNKIANDFSSCK